MYNSSEPSQKYSATPCGRKTVDWRIFRESLIKVGEIVVIMGFELSDKPILPKIILVDENNNFTNFVE